MLRQRKSLMALTLTLDEYTLPDSGVVDLRLNCSFEIKVTAEQARRQVKGWLLDQVSYMMTAQLPTLVISERIAWRVPVILTATHIGHVGVVGEVDVDVETGAMNNLGADKEAILAQAHRLAATLPPYQPQTSPPQAVAGDRLLTYGWPCLAAVDTGELPCWQSSVGHVVVLVGMDDESVYLNDPALPEAPPQSLLPPPDRRWCAPA
jgi:hypothetical protein